MTNETRLSLGLRLPFAAPETAWLLLAEAFEGDLIDRDEYHALWRDHQKLTARSVQTVVAS